MSSAECTCGEKFLDAEDYRDHLPCPGSRDYRRGVAVERQRVAEWLRRSPRGTSGLNALASAIERGAAEEEVDPDGLGLAALSDKDRARIIDMVNEARVVREREGVVESDRLMVLINEIGEAVWTKRPRGVQAAS
jgi:hypothetical protein